MLGVLSPSKLSLTHTGSIFAASISDATVVNSFFSVRSFVRLGSSLTVDGRTQLKNGEHRLWMSLSVAFVRVLCLQIGHGKGATMVVDKWGARIFVASC